MFLKGAWSFIRDFTLAVFTVNISEAMSEALALKYIGCCYLVLLYLMVMPWPAQDIA